MKLKTFMQVIVFICIALGVLNVWFDSTGLWWICGCILFCDAIGFVLVLAAGGYDDEL